MIPDINGRKIFLVRHGQDTDNVAGVLGGRRDTELTDLGREQSKQVALKLRDKNIQIIYASSLRRAYETACIVAAELGIDKVIPDERLIERDFGVLTGRPVADILKYTDKIISAEKVNYFLEVEGAEDFLALLDRGKRVLEEIKQRHRGENILIVTHGDIGKMIRAAFYNWSWGQGLKTSYFDNGDMLEL